MTENPRDLIEYAVDADIGRDPLVVDLVSALTDALDENERLRAVEAVEIDAFETELRFVTRNDEERADLRKLAIDAGKLALRPEDLFEMAHMWQRSKYMPATRPATTETSGR